MDYELEYLDHYKIQATMRSCAAGSGRGFELRLQEDVKEVSQTMLLPPPVKTYLSWINVGPFSA